MLFVDCDSYFLTLIDICQFIFQYKKSDKLAFYDLKLQKTNAKMA